MHPPPLLLPPQGVMRDGKMDRKKTRKTFFLVHLAYIIPQLRRLVGNWQFVKLTHFLWIILCYWRATAPFYNEPLVYKCLFSIFHFRWWYLKLTSMLQSAQAEESQGRGQYNHPYQKSLLYCSSMFREKASLFECVVNTASMKING